MTKIFYVFQSFYGLFQKIYPYKVMDILISNTNLLFKKLIHHLKYNFSLGFGTSLIILFEKYDNLFFNSGKVRHN
ncbi:protein of unknown function [[Clostridium] ultunense Esp]|uniref:Uncharacterized protein n=1 Tax=[Clostridium] ultunense Esp TaxID=1288971 RepID=A0A1M4PLN3_9FIRM|nr:protein of unknown function [[Clostridium] ultunense Esp]